MRSDAFALAAAALFLAACDEKPAGPPPERFAAVKKAPVSARAEAFCEKSFKPGERHFALPKTRELEGSPAPAKASGWRWLNVWATWCKPCVEEMGLLLKWRDALAREGAGVSFELLSIDGVDAVAELKQWQQKTLPGPILWLPEEKDLPALLEALGVDKGAGVPIHALIDPAGDVRCVRVGAIHDQDYGAVRELVGKE